MNKSEILSIIIKEKLVAVIRLKEQSKVAPIVKALVEGGMKVLEITSNTPGFLEEIQNVRNLYPNILIGAGTITNSRLANDAIAAGAQFLVTPNTDIKIIDIAHSNDIPILMGALTPTEISIAAEAGADIIKLFPASHFGVSYFKNLQGPFTNLIFFAVGGIDLKNANEWLSAGVSGLGLGGGLVKTINNSSDYENCVQLAKKYVKLVKDT